MGFKTKNSNIKQSNIKKPYQVGGLIFDSVDDFKLLEEINKNISLTVKSVEDSNIKLDKVFNNVKNINVKETYFNAGEELEGSFDNATRLLFYGGTRFTTDFKVGRCFFDKINIIKYRDSYSYSDSDSDSDRKMI